MLTSEQKLIALAQLGIASTVRGDKLTVHAVTVPSAKALAAAYAAYETKNMEPPVTELGQLSEQVELLQEKLQVVETELKKGNPRFKLPDQVVVK